MIFCCGNCAYKLKSLYHSLWAQMKLEAKRAQALEKMQNEMASAHRKAEEKKAVAEAKRAEKAAKAASDAERMRKTGKLPWTPGCLFIR